MFDLNGLIKSQIDPKIEKANNIGHSQFATVMGIGATGTVYLRFDGEEETSKKQYQRLNNYTPHVGDRVLLMRHSGTVLVIDKVVGIPEPWPLPEPDPPFFDEILIECEDGFKPGDVTMTIGPKSASITTEQSTYKYENKESATDIYTPIDFIHGRCIFNENEINYGYDVTERIK